MKKTLMLAAALLVSVSLLYAGTENKMEKLFKETFPTASNASWIKDDNGYMVSFTQNGTLTRVSYTNKGKFVSSLRYYQGKDLPTNILMAVKSKYKGKDIFGVTEYTSTDEVIYYIKLYDGTDYYSVKALSDGTVTDDNADNSGDDN
jgi:hypothetical protein